MIKVIKNGLVITMDETRKKYEIGQVISSEQQIYRYTNREDTLTDIREKLCTPLNIYIKVRKVSGKRYIDLVPLENHGQFCKGFRIYSHLPWHEYRYSSAGY